jgi:hypothetical protein
MEVDISNITRFVQVVQQLKSAGAVLYIRISIVVFGFILVLEFEYGCTNTSCVTRLSSGQKSYLLFIRSCEMHTQRCNTQRAGFIFVGAPEYGGPDTFML